jgi:hypothetical protein
MIPPPATRAAVTTAATAIILGATIACRQSPPIGFEPLTMPMSMLVRSSRRPSRHRAGAATAVPDARRRQTTAASIRLADATNDRLCAAIVTDRAREVEVKVEAVRAILVSSSRANMVAAAVIAAAAAAVVVMAALRVAAAVLVAAEVPPPPMRRSASGTSRLFSGPTLTMCSRA